MSIESVRPQIHRDGSAASRYRSKHGERCRGENGVGSRPDALFQELVCREPLDIVGEICDLLPQQQTEWIANGRKRLSTDRTRS